MKMLDIYKKSLTIFFFKSYKLVSVALLLLVCILSSQIRHLEKGFTQEVWFKKNDPRIQEYNKFLKKYGSDDTLILAVDFKRNSLNEVDLSIIHELTEEIGLISGVSSVESITNYSWIRGMQDNIEITPLIENDSVQKQDLERVKAALLDISELKGMFFDESQEISIIHARMHKSENNSDTYIQAIEELKDRIMMKDFRSEMEFHYAGTVAMTAGFVKISSQDMKLIIPMSLTILSVMLFFLLGNIKSVLIALLVVVVTMLSTLGTQSLMGVKITVITLMIPSIIIAIVVSDSVHILSTYLELKRGKPKSQNLEIVKKSILKNIFPTLLTTLSTFLGFITLTSSSLAPIRDLGVLVALGVMYAWVFSVFIIPFLLTYFPFEAHRRIEVRIVNDRRIRACLNWIQKNKKIIVFFTLVVFPLSIYLSFQNRVSSNMIKHFDESIPLRVSAELLNEKAGGVITVEALIKTKKERGVLKPQFLKSVDQYIKRIERVNGVQRVSSLIPILKQSNKVLNGGSEEFFKISDNEKSIAEQLFLYEISVSEGRSLDSLKDISDKELRITIQTNKIASRENSLLINSLREAGKGLDLDITLTGKGVLMQDLDSYILITFLSSIAQAILFITIFMSVVFKSWKIGLMSMIPNILPIVFGATVLKILKMPLDVGTILIVSATLGIAVDDTIFFLNSYFKNSKMYKNEDSYELLFRIFKEISNALIITTITLVSSFSVFLLGSFEPNQSFGGITAIILIVALVADLILLPAIIMTFRKRES